MISQDDSHDILSRLITNFCSRKDCLLLEEKERPKNKLLKFFSNLLPRISTIINAFFRLRSCVEKSRNTNKRIVLREFTSVEILAFVIYFWAGKNVVLNINHNLSGGLFRIYLLKILTKLEYKFMLIDAQNCLNEINSLLGTKIITFSSADYLSLEDKLRVSKVKPTKVLFLGDGISNLDKAELCKRLSSLNIQASYGVRSNVVDSIYAHNLSSRKAYLENITATDIVVFLPNIKKYTFRHSGTIWDVIQVGKMLIYPDMCVFNMQLSSYQNSSKINSYDLNEIYKIIWKQLND